MTATRNEIVASIVGTEWFNSGKCWGLVQHVQLKLFQRELPDIEIPDGIDWHWIITTLQTHSERANWIELPHSPMNSVIASDGALIRMARSMQPIHIGVWLKPERMILHAPVIREGVQKAFLETVAQCEQIGGWRKLTYFEYRGKPQ